MRWMMAAGLALAFVGHAVAAEPGPDNLVIGCTGPFGWDADRSTLVAVFGAANVVDADVDVGEGMTEPGTLLYADDPERRLIVFWADTERRAHPATIMVREDKSRWRGPADIGIGTPIAAVEAANGRPFDVLGFDWDLGGYAGNWQDGALASATGAPDCNLSMRFRPTASGEYATGDAVFASNAPEVRAAEPVVQQFSIGWNREWQPQD